MKKTIAAILSLALMMGFTACSGNSASSSPQPPRAANHRIERVVFPAYDLANPQNIPILEMVNQAPKFYLEIPLQENWEIKTEKGDETVPTGEWYTPVYIYERDQLIGYIGFIPFAFDIPEGTSHEGAYPLIHPNLRLSSQFQWEPYTAVKTTENGEIGVAEIDYMDPNDIENHPGAMPDVDQFHTTGIVAYDMTLKVSAAIAFMPDSMSKNQAIELAKEIEMIPIEND